MLFWNFLGKAYIHSVPSASTKNQSGPWLGRTTSMLYAIIFSCPLCMGHNILFNCNIISFCLKTLFENRGSLMGHMIKENLDMAQFLEISFHGSRMLYRIYLGVFRRFFAFVFLNECLSLYLNFSLSTSHYFL